MAELVVAHCRRNALCVFLAGFLAACTTSEDDHVESIPAYTLPGASSSDEVNGLLLIFVRAFSFEQNVDDISEERPFVACVREAVLETRPSQTMVTFDDFHQTFFPHLKRRSVPRDPTHITAYKIRRNFDEA